MIAHLFRRVQHALRDVGHPKRSSQWPKVEKAHIALHPHCAACGSALQVQVHHIHPFHLFPELELVETNLISLCMSKNDCHLVIGHSGAFSRWNPEIEKMAKEVREKKLTLSEARLQAVKLARK